MQAAEVVTAARAQMGVPWRHQGRLPGRALDCAGLVICVARELGLVAPDFEVTGYTRTPDGTMLDWCRRYCTPIGAPELGALAVIVCQRQPQHLGIVGDYVHGGLSLIHASTAAKPARVVEHRLMWTTAMRLVAAFRLPGVA